MKFSLKSGWDILKMKQRQGARGVFEFNTDLRREGVGK
jgi:hypothetical protein